MCGAISNLKPDFHVSSLDLYTIFHVNLIKTTVPNDARCCLAALVTIQRSISCSHGESLHMAGATYLSSHSHSSFSYKHNLNPITSASKENSENGVHTNTRQERRQRDCFDRQWCLPALNPRAAESAGIDAFNKGKCSRNLDLPKCPFVLIRQFLQDAL